jgi:hypothetical protein
MAKFDASNLIQFLREKWAGAPCPMEWNNVLTFMTGAPFDVNGNNIGANGRPNYHGGCSVNPGGYVWLSCPTSAFTWIDGNTVGNLPRNYFHGPGYHDWDTGITKNIPVGERVKTELRLQAYNLTNTPQFQNPDGNIGSWNAGVLSPNSNFGKETTVRQDSWREIELAFRVTF